MNTSEAAINLFADIEVRPAATVREHLERRPDWAVAVRKIDAMLRAVREDAREELLAELNKNR